MMALEDRHPTAALKKVADKIETEPKKFGAITEEFGAIPQEFGAIPREFGAMPNEVGTIHHAATEWCRLAGKGQKRSCSSYYALSFLIPFFTVFAVYSYDCLGACNGYVEAITAAVLAGVSGLCLYSSAKYFKHRLPGRSHLKG